MDSRYKEKTFATSFFPSYGSSYTGKTASLYWDAPLILPSVQTSCGKISVRFEASRLDVNWNFHVVRDIVQAAVEEHARIQSECAVANLNIAVLYAFVICRQQDVFLFHGCWIYDLLPSHHEYSNVGEFAMANAILIDQVTTSTVLKITILHHTPRGLNHSHLWPTWQWKYKWTFICMKTDLEDGCHSLIDDIQYRFAPNTSPWLN